MLCSHMKSRSFRSGTSRLLGSGPGPLPPAALPPCLPEKAWEVRVGSDCQRPILTLRFLPVCVVLLVPVPACLCLLFGSSQLPCRAVPGPV